MTRRVEDIPPSSPAWRASLNGMVNRALAAQASPTSQVRLNEAFCQSNNTANDFTYRLDRLPSRGNKHLSALRDDKKHLIIWRSSMALDLDRAKCLRVVEQQRTTGSGRSCLAREALFQGVEET
jgi:hypothetical protein